MVIIQCTSSLNTTLLEIKSKSFIDFRNCPLQFTENANKDLVKTLTEMGIKIGECKAVNECLETKNEKLEGQNEKFDALNAKLETLNEKFHDKLEAQNDKFFALNEKLETLNEKFDYEFEAINEKLQVARIYVSKCLMYFKALINEVNTSQSQEELKLRGNFNDLE